MLGVIVPSPQLFSTDQFSFPTPDIKTKSKETPPMRPPHDDTYIYNRANIGPSHKTPASNLNNLLPARI
jgi:hypothetical protein